MTAGSLATDPQAAAKPDTPAWFTPLLVWRVLVAAGLAFLLTTRRGIAIEGTNRVVLLAGIALALGAAAAAVYHTYRRRHAGRLLGFTVDLLIAAVVGFIALNRMNFFNGLDAVGARFNQRIFWLTPIIIGWLVSAWSERGGQTRPTVQRTGRLLMVGGAAVMAIAMGLLGAIPGVLGNLVDPANAPGLPSSTSR